MRTKEILNFEDVILFELQKQANEGKRAELFFRDIIRACAKAGANFAIPNTPEKKKNYFYGSLFGEIEKLQLTQ